MYLTILDYYISAYLGCNICYGSWPIMKRYIGSYPGVGAYPGYYSMLTNPPNLLPWANTHTTLLILDQWSQVKTGVHIVFSIEDELRFTIHDLYDEKYELWLNIHHPESVSKRSKDSTAASVTPFISSTSYMPLPSTSSYVPCDQPYTSGTAAPKAPSIPAMTIYDHSQSTHQRSC